MTAHWPVLIHSALYAALRRLPAARRSRFRRLAERLASGQWGGGTRVKKLRGVAKPVFEARQDDGHRVLFTLARSAALAGDGLATHLQVWDLVAHDDVSPTAARINGSPEAEFLDYEVLESETTGGPPPHPGVTFDQLPARPGAEPGILEVMLPPEDFRPQDREEIAPGIRWYLLPERLLLEEGEWQALMDGGSDELELKLTAEQYAVVRAPGPVLLSGSAGSGKTTIAVHRLAASGGGPARAVYLTYSGWLRDHARRLFEALVACRGVATAAAPSFLTMEELYRRLVGEGGPPTTRLVDYPEFARWYRDRFRRTDAALAWEEIRSIVKGACLDERRPLLERERYEALGRKRAPLFVAERPRLYDVARRWQEWLEQTGRADEIDLCRRALGAARRGREAWDHVICDEAQDLAEIHVELLLRLQGGSRLDGLFLAGDPQQVINPSGFRWAEVRTAIRDRFQAFGRPAPALSSLTLNFRSVRGVVDLANELLALKRERTGKSDGDETEEAVVAGATPIRVEGDEEELLVVVAGFGPRCAVLVGSEEARARLQARLDTTRIFTVPEAKGLEFDVVVLWGVVAADPEPWRRLLDPGLDLREDPACRRVLHHLYVAVTRARRHLAVLEPPEAPPLWTCPRFAARLDPEPAVSLARLFVHAASPAEWLREAEYFAERGRHRQAAECFRRAGQARREAECLALHHERVGEGAVAARLWLVLGEPARAARCFEDALVWPEAARLWVELGDRPAAERCRARAAERARDWPAAGAAWEALGDWREAGRCWGNAGQRGRQLRCLGEADEAEGRWTDAARRWEEAEVWERAAAAWRRAGRERDAARADALGHEVAGRWPDAAGAWHVAGDELRARHALAVAAETEGRWAAAAPLWEETGDLARAVRAWRRAGQPREATRCEARADLAAGRYARAADALETLGDFAAAADAWRRAGAAGQQPIKAAPLALPSAATRRWTEGGRPAALAASRGPRAARAMPSRDARVRSLACDVSAAEAAGRLEQAEALWADLGDLHQALRCRVGRLEAAGDHAAAAAVLEEHGLFPAAGRAWAAAGEPAGVGRCEAKGLEKKRRFAEAAGRWSSLGESTRAAVCRARALLAQGDYERAAQAFAEAGDAAAALDLRLLAARRAGDWARAIALAEAAERPELVAHLRQARAASASRPQRGAGGGASAKPRQPRPPREADVMARPSARADGDVAKVAAAVRRRPGARSNDVETLTGIRPPRLGALLRQAVAAGVIVRSGATRATRYWPAAPPSRAGG